MGMQYQTSLGPVIQHGADVRIRHFHPADVIEGIGCRVAAYISPTVLTAYTVVNAYHVEAAGNEYWLIGKAFTFGSLDRPQRRRLEHRAYLLTGLGVLSLNGPLSHIVFSLGDRDAIWTESPESYGLRELSEEEVKAAPRRIRKQALPSWRKSGRTGLYCPDADNLSLLANEAAELLGATTISFHDGGHRSGAFQPKVWPFHAAKMLRMLQTIDTIYLEIGRLRSDWPRGKTEEKLKSWTGNDQIDAICLRLCYEVDGEMIKFCRARGYPITSPTAPIVTSNMWWVLGDLLIHNLARDKELQKKLTVARVMVFKMLDTPLNQIVIPLGRSARNGLEPCLRELNLEEMLNAPREILKFSAEAREIWPESRTGLACPNGLKADDFSRLAEEIINDKPMIIHGALKHVKLRCGSTLRTCLDEGRIELARFGWRAGI